MRYEIVQQLDDEGFKRCTGVQRSTFKQMLVIVEAGMRNFGRPTTLSRDRGIWMILGNLGLLKIDLLNYSTHSIASSSTQHCFHFIIIHHRL